MYFFVDLDGTLKTDRDFIGGKKAEISEKLIGDKIHQYIIRPHVKEFLTILKKSGSVFIYTLSSLRYARFFVDEMDVKNLVDEIYSRDNLEDLPKVPSYCIIENDPEIAKGKAVWLEKKSIILKKQIIIVPTYNGNSDDNVLLNCLDKIEFI